MVSQRGLGEADTEALLGIGGVADVASVDVVPPSLLRRRLQAHMALARARHQSQLSPAPSWQSLSGQLLQMERVARPRPSDSGDRGAIKERPGGAGDEHDDADDSEDEDEAEQGKEKQSSSERGDSIADGSTPHHLSVVESVLLQLDQQGRAVLPPTPQRGGGSGGDHVRLTRCWPSVRGGLPGAEPARGAPAAGPLLA